MGVYFARPENPIPRTNIEMGGGGGGGGHRQTNNPNAAKYAVASRRNANFGLPGVSADAFRTACVLLKSTFRLDETRVLHPEATQPQHHQSLKHACRPAPVDKKNPGQFYPDRLPLNWHPLNWHTPNWHGSVPVQRFWPSNAELALSLLLLMLPLLNKASAIQQGLTRTQELPRVFKK